MEPKGDEFFNLTVEKVIKKTEKEKEGSKISFSEVNFKKKKASLFSLGIFVVPEWL